MPGLLRTSRLICIFVILVFCAGLVFGFFGSQRMGPEGQSEIASHLNFFLEDFGEGLDPEVTAAFRDSVLFNLRLLGLIWVMGLVVVGLPVVVLLIFIRGFVLGFTLGFLIESMRLRGLLFSLISILPQNLFFIPALLFTGVSALRFALAVISRKPGHRRTIGEGFFSYSVLVVVGGIIVFLGSLVEAYLSPHLIHYYSRYLGQ